MLKKKENKGITLIALVITVIILLILAGVTIAAISGDNGILAQASRAKQESEKASIIEQIRLDIMEKQTENEGIIYDEDFYQILENYGSISEDETKLTTIKGNYEIIISDIYNGEVKRKSNNLININDLKYGVQIYNGVESSYAGAICTGYIEVQDVQAIYLSNRYIQIVNFYDENKSYIGFQNSTDGTILTDGFTVPESTKYMRISFKNDDMPNSVSYDDFIADVWVGNKNCVSYEPYGQVNYKNSYPDTIENDRIFRNTIFHSATYLSYGEGCMMTIIEPKKDIPFYIFGLGDTVTLCYLNENLEVLQKIPSPDLSYSCFKTDEVPDAKYISISCQNMNFDNLNIQMEYYYQNIGESVLDNKIVVGYGDSLTQGSSTSKTTWLGKIAQYYNIQQVNRGIGGTRVTADTRTAWVTPNGEYLASEIQGDSEPTEEHITINSSMSHDERIATIPTNADIILFFGGTNGMDEESYRATLDKMKTRAPNAKIICMNITYRQTEDEDEEIAEDYENRRNIINDIAQEYGYPVIQLKELMGVDKTNASQYMVDKVHFNNAGYTKIAIAVINQLKQSIQDGYIK